MRAAVVTFPGSNCDHDCVHVSSAVLGWHTSTVWHKDTSLPAVDLVILPGGFSYGDYLRSGAIARFSPIMGAVVDFAQKGGYVLGICNGFQILQEAGLLPGAMLRNASLRFVCKDVHLAVVNRETALTCLAPDERPLRMPVAHNEGNFYADDATIERLEARGQVLFRYVDEHGARTPEANPNGAVGDIAGVTNETFTVFGLMPHPERAAEPSLGGTDGRVLFESLAHAMERGGVS